LGDIRRQLGGSLRRAQPRVRSRALARHEARPRDRLPRA
jgi:hypothetical protein